MTGAQHRSVCCWARISIIIEGQTQLKHSEQSAVALFDEPQRTLCGGCFPHDVRC